MNKTKLFFILLLLILLIGVLTSCTKTNYYSTKTNYYRVEEGNFHIHLNDANLGNYGLKYESTKIIYYLTTVQIFISDDVSIETTPEKVFIIRGHCPVCEEK